MAVPKYNPHYTLADYRQWEGSWELWHGVAVAMTPSPFGIHQWLSGQFARTILNQLDEQGCGDSFVVQDVDWVIADDFVVRPDISLVNGELPERFIETAPEVVIEILSESTFEKDTQSKKTLYAKQGVRYYVMVDPWRWECDIFELRGAKYQPLKPGIPLIIHGGGSLRLGMPIKPEGRKKSPKPKSSKEKPLRED
jgi:Uma2 family endonuclease